MINFSKFNNLIDLLGYFTDNKICRAFIKEHRWGSDIVCPYCGHHHCYTRSDGKFRCPKCCNNFSVLKGTIFENTKIPLVKWFAAMYLISAHKKGISSHQLSRDIHVTQKSAWYILHKVRSLYPQDDSESFSGQVECDEVYIGGKEKWKHKSMRTPHTQGRSTATKTPVFGLMQRSFIIDKRGEKVSMSYVHAFVVGKTDGATLIPIIEQFVEKGANIYTDELTSYNHVAEKGYNHKICNHSINQYVDGDAYTNNMEGFWSHFRRMIIGCYHDISDPHLQSYVNEACFRWNTRKMDSSERFAYMFRKSVGMIIPNRKFKLCKVAA